MLLVALLQMLASKDCALMMMVVMNSEERAKAS